MSKKTTATKRTATKARTTVAKAKGDGKAAAKSKAPARKSKVKDSPGGVAMTVFRNQAVVNRAQRDAKGKAAAKPASTAKSNAKPRRLSALDAATQVLQAAGQPMRAQELIAAMAEQNLWKSPAGATPHATLYAAMLREINLKGKDARFTKVERGLFTFNA